MQKPLLEPYLYFNGNCREAMAFYEKVFQAAPARIMTYGDLPGMPDTTDPDQVMHASIDLGGLTVMASDDITAEVHSGSSVYLNYCTYDDAEAQRIWDSMVEAGAEVEMPLQPEFFASLFGSLKDPYGITWQIMGVPQE